MKFSLLLLASLVFLFAFPTMARAHFSNTSGTLTGVLHVDPDDDPVAGEPAFIGIEFMDPVRLFKPGRCDCVLSVIQDEQVLHTALFEERNPYTFPTPGVYTIQVKGVPSVGYDFPAFTVEFDFRVEKVTEEVASRNRTIEYISYGVIACALIFIALILKNRYNHH